MNDCESNTAEAVSGTDNELEPEEATSPSTSGDGRPGESPGEYWHAPGAEDGEDGDTAVTKADVRNKSSSTSRETNPAKPGQQISIPLELLEENTASSDNANGNGPVSPITQIKEVQSPKLLKRTNLARPKAKPAKVSQNGPINTANKLESSDLQGDEPEGLPAVLPINVGGYRFMTRLSTLCKFPDSMLAAMFSGRHKLDRDKNGYYFIDSNGIYFGYILDYLRHETMPPTDVAINVYKEACYYNIGALMEKLQSCPPVAKVTVRDAHRAQFPDYYGLKQRVIKQAVQNAVVNQTGEVTLYAFQKVFTPRAPYFNTQHDCVADTADLAIGPWDSPADEEVLVRCLEQDLINEGFTIKPHEQRRRCKYYNGQNCQKSVYRITFYFA